jgi:hypothetical protein
LFGVNRWGRLEGVSSHFGRDDALSNISYHSRRKLPRLVIPHTVGLRLTQPDEGQYSARTALSQCLQGPGFPFPYPHSTQEPGFLGNRARDRIVSKVMCDSARGQVPAQGLVLLPIVVSYSRFDQFLVRLGRGRSTSCTTLPRSQSMGWS